MSCVDEFTRIEEFKKKMNSINGKDENEKTRKKLDLYEQSDIYSDYIDVKDSAGVKNKVTIYYEKPETFYNGMAFSVAFSDSGCPYFIVVKKDENDVLEVFNLCDRISSSDIEPISYCFRKLDETRAILFGIHSPKNLLGRSFHFYLVYLKKNFNKPFTKKEISFKKYKELERLSVYEGETQIGIYHDIQSRDDKTNNILTRERINE